MVNWRNTQPPKLEAKNEIQTVFDMVTHHIRELDFQYCSFTMSSQVPNNVTKPIQINNYPNGWNNLYQQAHFFEVDPVVAHCKRCVLPIVWEEKTFGTAPGLWSLAQSFGVHQAWTQPVHDFQGVYSMLTLGRGCGEVSPQELYEKAGNVLWLCHAMHAVVAQQYAHKPSTKAQHTLTARETEILKWSGMGKTAEEIASIISISPRTVTFHVSSALRKLGVTNKIAAVLCASRAGLF